MFMVPNQRGPGLNVFVVAAGRPAGRRSVQGVLQGDALCRTSCRETLCAGRGRGRPTIQAS